MLQDPVRFQEIFNQWAETYDEFVYRNEGEYAEVFQGYDRILERTVELLGQRPGDTILDIGAGTGNLAYVAWKKGYRVIPIEPNQAMRAKGEKKYPEVPFQDGNFLDLPFPDGSVQGIISSYAFHHLTDEEKREAILLFRRLLSNGGRVVIADTMYEHEEMKESLLKEALAKGFRNLAEDLEREFYTTHAVLRSLFEQAGFSVSFEPMNRFVWILQAEMLRALAFPPRYLPYHLPLR